MSLTSVEVDADSQRGARHWHQGIRFVCRVKWNSSDSLMNRVKQERAHTCSETVQYDTFFFLGHTKTYCMCDCSCKAVSYLHRTAVLF